MTNCSFRDYILGITQIYNNYKYLLPPPNAKTVISIIYLAQKYKTALPLAAVASLIIQEHALEE